MFPLRPSSDTENRFSIDHALVLENIENDRSLQRLKIAAF